MQKLSNYFGAVVFLYFLNMPCFLNAQIPGCTDSLANNFNPAATSNDGSCLYNITSVTPLNSFGLSPLLIETSGLIHWNNSLWTHNDNTETKIYELDTIDGTLIATTDLVNISNTDWEEIAQDSLYFYIGDFGNNANGNRTNLHLLRIEKNSFVAGQPIIDTIKFSYADQTIFTPTGGNNTDFDCEAFVVGADSIFLFTKQWVTNGTVVYGFPKTPGTHLASNLQNYNVQGLVTGATYLPSLNLIVLSGYSPILQPFLFCIYDFNNTDFFSGNKRKLNLTLPFHQVEAIASNNGLKYYISNEFVSQPPIITVNQQLHILDLTQYLGPYISSIISGISNPSINSFIQIYPNPSNDIMVIEYNGINDKLDFTITDLSGNLIIEGILNKGTNTISIANLAVGNYLIKSGNDYSYQISIVR